MAQAKSTGNIPEGIYARIPLNDVILAEARDLVEDAAFWTSTRALVCFHYPQVSLSGYWELTVGEHRELYEFLQEQGFAPAMVPAPPAPSSPLVAVAEPLVAVADGG